MFTLVEPPVGTERDKRRFRVRWRFAGRDRKRSFKTKTEAERFRTHLHTEHDDRVEWLDGMGLGKFDPEAFDRRSFSDDLSTQQSIRLGDWFDPNMATTMLQSTMLSTMLSSSSTLTQNRIRQGCLRSALTALAISSRSSGSNSPRLNL